MGEESMRIDDGIADWEAGLPSADDLTPLSQSLIPMELASAFKITAEPSRSMIDVNRASQTTLSSLRSSAPNYAMADSDPDPPEVNGGSDPKRIRQTDDEEAAIENCEQGKAAKRPRLVWTPQLHKRFVDVVGHLGLKNAVPKTIMQLMNVEGLTRENVASHLQKYRLYVKRMQGLSNEGPSPSDHLFASTPLPPTQSFNESSSGGHGSANGTHKNNNNCNGSISGSGNNNNNHVGMQIMQMPMMGMAAGNVNSVGGYNGNEAGNSHYHHHHHHHHYQQQYSHMMQQQRDWPGNQYNNAYSHHVTQNNK